MRSLVENPDFGRDITSWLGAWKLWILAVFLGALMGSTVYFIFPPDYRAHAAVTVDHNLEQAWPESPDREMFYYLQRETEKLESVAWADATLKLVAAQSPSGSIEMLRDEVLKLSQPQDGEWHFWADSPDRSQAQSLAASWAKAFVSEVQYGTEIATQIHAAQNRLEIARTSQETAELTAVITELQSKSLGITPYLQVSLAQTDMVPVSRSIGLGTYLMAGSGLAVLLVFMYLTFLSKAR